MTMKVEYISPEMKATIELFFKLRTASVIDYSRGSINPFGTGVFVAIDGKPYLLGAAHVWDDGEEYGDFKIVSFFLVEKAGNDAKRVWWTPKKSAVIRLDRQDGVEVDLMAIRLDKWVLEKCPEIFVHESNIDLKHEFTTEKTYEVVGYPTRLFIPTKDNSPANPALLKMLTYGTGILEQDKWDPKYSHDHHIMLTYPPEMEGLNGESVEAPNPKGMSGGGIWEISKSGAVWAVESKCKLVGIQFAWEKGSRILIGSRIKPLIEAIKKAG